MFKNVLLFVIDQYSFTINGNKIGDSGACSIGEGLKVNSTVTTISLCIEIGKTLDTLWFILNMILKFNEMNEQNQIGDSGGCSIGEVLKVNSTLTRLDLEMRS